MTERLSHRPPDPLRHLSAVAEVTRRSQQIALAALHEALTAPVEPGRVAQLRRVTDDLNREVRRLEDAIRETYPEAVEDPAALIRRRLIPGEAVDPWLVSQINGLAAKLGEEYPVTGEDAAGLGQELAEAGDVAGLRNLRDVLLLEEEDATANGPELDALLYGAPIVRKDDPEVDRADELRAGNEARGLDRAPGNS